MRSGLPISVRNATVANTATAIFSPSAAAAALGAGTALIRNIRIIQGAAHTTFTINSFNPAGAGTATARFGIARPAATESRFEGLHLAFPLGHGCTALGSVGGADGLLQIDGDRVDEGARGLVRSAYGTLTDAGFAALQAGAAGRQIILTRVVTSGFAAGTIVRVGYDDDGAGTNFIGVAPDIVDAVGDFTFKAKLPVAKYLTFQSTGAADVTAYVEYTYQPPAAGDDDVRTAVVNETAGGAGTTFLNLHNSTTTEIIELVRVLGYSSAAGSVLTVGYTDNGGTANYVPLTSDLANGNRTDKLSFVCPRGKRLMARHVAAGTDSVRANVEYRVLST